MLLIPPSALLRAMRLVVAGCGNMPASLLPRQPRTLEPPAPDQGTLAFDVAAPPAATVHRLVQSLEHA